ncbi:hypothetical protein SAMN05216238_102391 [Lentibacillus persicus]|uniref:Uncharacterized protein n=1 Tax=Lentibacillus persicus TaxID=640948 RepID=A0A1I1TW77_9BACI|nr:hypothetical protein [Lentibacillus persicus]SFD60703.1 hypothetical protein SAMN05216238_102391 [Lentibacillus persicus]
MLVINKRRLRDAKIERLKEGKNAYTESAELTRLVQQQIQRENLNVVCDQTNTGCWFIPLPAQKSS